jgi:hypothetical protein
MTPVVAKARMDVSVPRGFSPDKKPDVGMDTGALAAHDNEGRGPGYAAEATRALHFAFASQMKEPACVLEAKVVRRTINAIADADRKAIARLTAAYGRACYAWAAGRDLVPANPFGGIKTEAVPFRAFGVSPDVYPG